MGDGGRTGMRADRSASLAADCASRALLSHLSSDRPVGNVFAASTEQLGEVNTSTPTGILKTVHQILPSIDKLLDQGGGISFIQKT